MSSDQDNCWTKIFLTKLKSKRIQHETILECRVTFTFRYASVIELPEEVIQAIEDSQAHHIEKGDLDECREAHQCHLFGHELLHKFLPGLSPLH